MRKNLSGILGLALVFAFAAAPEGFAAARVEVRLAPVGASYAPPRLAKKQGWLTVTNRDWKPYTVHITREGRMSLTEGALPTGTVIRSGTSVTMAVEKDTWELLGPSGDKLKCRVREGRTSTISLEPFGFANASGLRGVSNDGERVRDEVLVPAYEPPPAVIVQRPPAVIVERPPVIVHTPPPVIVQRPPVIVAPRPHRRPTHRAPVRRDRDRDGWGFTFGFNSR